MAHSSTPTWSQSNKQDLRNLVKWSSMCLMEDEIGVARYFERFRTLSDPLLFYCQMSKEECNKLFWRGFCDYDRAMLFPYLIDNTPSQWPGAPTFNFRDLFDLAHAFFSRMRLNAEAIAKAKNKAEAEAEIARQRKLAEEEEERVLESLIRRLLPLSIHDCVYAVRYRQVIRMFPEAVERLPKPEFLPDSVQGATSQQTFRDIPLYAITHSSMASCNTDPPSTPSNPSVSLKGGLPVADRPANLDANNPAGTNASNGATEPEDFLYRELSLSEPCWPADLVLDMKKDNWPEWSRRLTLLADRLRFSGWLDGSLTRPDPNVYPNAHQTWEENDRAVRAVILERVSESDYWLVEHLRESHAVFEELRKRHERGSIYSQMLLLMKLSDMQFEPTTPMSETVGEMKRLYARIVKMGRIDDDRLLTFLAMRAFGEQSRHLPSAIQADINVPGNSSTALFQYIEAGESNLRCRSTRGAVQPGVRPPPTTTAPIVVTNGVSHILTPGRGAR